VSLRDDETHVSVPPAIALGEHEEVAIGAVVFDIGGVLELTPPSGWQQRWARELEAAETVFSTTSRSASREPARSECARSTTSPMIARSLSSH
jgi:hypothetical protein